MKILFALIVVLLFFVSSGNYAVGLMAKFDGEQAKNWETHAVVLAKVSSVRADFEEKHEVVGLEVFACVTGAFDPALKPELEMPIFRFSNSAIRDLPEEGRFALVLVGRKILNKDGALGEYYFPTSVVDFMPNNCAIWQFDGLEDEDFQNAIRRISRMRQGLGGDAS